MRSQKLKILVAALALAFLCAAGCAAYTIPDVDGWINGELRETKFDTVSGYRGLWLERDYRTGAGVPFRTVWMEGSGEKSWTTPKGNISDDDGLMGSGAKYKTLEVAGEKAILENHPLTGLSLVVKIAGRGTLTLESQPAKEDEIISVAEKIIPLIKEQN